tara:strand:+ start:382 stop:741 length:360 start_codon:yes stop_codon:yes gene_type:complete
LKSIAINYVVRGSFFWDVIAFFPFAVVYPLQASDPERQALRNIFTLKMIRMYRLGTSFIPEKASSDLVASFFEPSSRDEKIAQDRSISNIVQTINQIIIILVATYFFGLWWYRLSDYIF